MVRKKDLSDQILNKKRVSEFLFCSICGAEYSANSGDYWNLSDNYIFNCCDESMQLAVKHTEISILK